ncbi:hypothetical protein [Paenimyroides aestuarii]|uniref:Lipoprotein n=1 Tax=Paenimyroides aestuarii TaxID=2968490 RepID=A0ABY5NPM7_9FLAO|nr:hypothetical protein [Paenimyroides aestuarii]UUV20478.1 hypothetical protein NPX36_08875 [Paenimyroides aestuarii]
MKTRLFAPLFFCVLVFACSNQSTNKNSHSPNELDEEKTPQKQNNTFFSDAKTIHVFVALCDNKFQGIVPVPQKIGNGQDPDNNLYWGCAFGVRSYFKKSTDWKFLESRTFNSEKLERIIFKHTTKNYYLVADAYNGKFIKQTTVDFLNSSCGKIKDTLKIGKTTIGIEGNADLLAYVGHDGLMDFEIKDTFENTDNIKRNTIILACYSKNYFSQHLMQANINPLVWSTHLMSPEAYTLHDALTGYIKGETNAEIRTRAAKAYAKYQKCSEKAAKNLLVTGW